tara:strand:- start:115 stop:600 length:486 start_codon:yes stop_codon:yes gene_type:complete
MGSKINESVRRLLEYPIKENKQHNHIALIIHNGKIIYQSVAENCMNRTYINGKTITSLHAEINAWRKFCIIHNIYQPLYYYNTLPNKLKKCNLLVLRKMADGSIGNSKPCNNCLKSLSPYIKYIYYSDEEGDIIKDTIHNLLNNSYITKANKNVIKKYYLR